MECRETVGGLIVLERRLMLGKILLVILIPVLIKLLGCKLGDHFCAFGNHCHMAGQSRVTGLADAGMRRRRKAL